LFLSPEDDLLISGSSAKVHSHCNRNLDFSLQSGLSFSFLSGPSLADAARGLYHIAAGGRCQIDAAGQTRIAELAHAVRKLIESKPLNADLGRLGPVR
jgi:hypothetical protein